MAYTARLTKQQLRQRRDATRDRSRDNTKGTVQYLVTYAYTNNNCLLCASNIIVSVAIPTILTPIFLTRNLNFRQKYSFLTPFVSQFIRCLTSHNSTSQNIGGTGAWAVPPPQIFGGPSPSPPKSPPMIPTQ